MGLSLGTKAPPNPELDALIERSREYMKNRTPRQEFLDRWASRISYVYGEMGFDMDDNPRERTMSREDIARQLLTHEIGPAYAAEQLADPEFRKACRLDETTAS